MNTPRVRVGDLAEQIRGVTYRKEDAETSPQPGYLPVLRAGNITDDGLVFNNLVFVPAERISKKQKIYHNDILVAASSGSLDVVGKTAPALADYEGGFGAFCKVLRPNQKVDPAYFAQFFKTPEYRHRISTLAAGANINNLRNEHLDDVEIPLPPLEEQRRIADILDKADALRAKRRAALAQLGILTNAIFFDLFGPPIVSRTNWPVSTLREVCDKITDGTHRSPPIQPMGLPYITAKHLKKYGLDFESDPWFISEQDHRQIFSRCDPRPGDILYIKDGVTTGIAAVNHYTFEFSMLSSLALLRPKPTRIEAAYLCHWLNDPLVKRELLGGMAGAAIRRLTLAKINAIRIPVPSIARQYEFATKVAAIEKLKIAYGGSQAKLDELFSSIQYHAFQGEL